MKGWRSRRGAAPDAERQREVERSLAGQGLRPGPRRVAETSPSSESEVLRLGRALADLGGGFSDFGSFLDTRWDLFGSEDCLALAELPFPPAPAEKDVEKRITEELGEESARLFSSLEALPMSRSALGQSHRAWLPDGRAVVVELRSATTQDEIQRDAPMLPMLQRCFPETRAPFSEVLSDYRDSLPTRLELDGHIVSLGEAARVAASMSDWTPPRVLPELCSPRILTTELVGGVPLEQLVRGAGGAMAAHELLRRLAGFWLRLCFSAGRVPVRLAVEGGEDGKLALMGGSFAELPRGSRQILRRYLEAVAAGDPCGAMAHLEREIRVPDGGRVKDDLSRRLRQAVPFEEGLPGSESLSRHLMLHWRLIRDCGYSPSPHLQAFYQGVFSLGQVGRRLTGRAGAPWDGLRVAFEDQRWAEQWEELAEMRDPVRLATAFESAMNLLTTLPVELGRGLEPTSPGPVVGRSREKSSGGERSEVIASYGLVMATLVLVVWKLSTLEPGPGPLWGERIVALLFLYLGLRLLRAAGGS